MSGFGTMTSIHKLSLALLLAVLAVAMAQPDSATRRVPSSAYNETIALCGLGPVAAIDKNSPADTSSCLFNQKDVTAQDLNSIKKACGECCRSGWRCCCCCCCHWLFREVFCCMRNWMQEPA